MPSDETPGPGRKLGFWMCVALVMGNMIGSGVFLLPASLAPLGWNAIIGWGVTIGGTLCLALVFSRLARLLPGGSGTFTYAAEAFGPAVGFVVAWSFWISCWTANAALAVAATSNLSVVFPGLAAKGSTPALLAILFIALFTGINLLGVRKAGGTQVITLLLKLIPLLGAIGVAIWLFGAGTATPPALSQAAPVSLANVGTSATLTLFALLGFESALAAGDRVENPETNVPRATMAGAVATGIIYLLSCTAVTILLPVAVVSGSNAPYATYFSTFVSPAAGQIVALFAAIAALGALNGFILLAGELPRDLGNRGLLPAAFSKENRNGAPTWSLLLSSIFAGLIVYANFTRGLAGLFNFMVLVTTSTAIIFYLVGALSALNFERQGRITASPGFAALTIIGIAYSAWAFYGAGIEASLWGLAMTATGIPIYLAMKASAPARREQPPIP